MTRSPRQRRVAAIVAFAAALAGTAACDPVDGTDPYALWEAHEPADGAFHFHTLEPPWEAGEDGTADAPVRVLDPSGEAATPSTGPGARARVEARRVDAASAAEAAQSRRAGWEAAGYAVDAPEIFASRAHDLGVAQRAARGEIEAVDVLFERADGVVLLTLWGEGSLATDDFRLLLEGFEPRGSGEH